MVGTAQVAPLSFSTLVLVFFSRRRSLLQVDYRLYRERVAPAGGGLPHVSVYPLCVCMCVSLCVYVCNQRPLIDMCAVGSPL